MSGVWREYRCEMWRRRNSVQWEAREFHVAVGKSHDLLDRVGFLGTRGALTVDGLRPVPGFECERNEKGSQGENNWESAI